MSSFSSEDAALTGPRRALATLLARTVRAEWSRLWTVRSAWWFAIATAVAVLGLGVILGIDVHGDPRSRQPTGTAWLGGQITAIFGLYGLLAFSVVAVTADFATGGMVPSLQATPRRGILLTARTATVVTFSTVFGCLLIAGASAIVYAFAPEMGLPTWKGLGVIATVAFVYAAGMAVAVGIGQLARNTGGSLIAVLALMLVLPLMFSLLPFEWSAQVADLLPGTGALFLLTTDAASPMREEAAYTTLAAWAIFAMAAGAVRLFHSDVSH